MMQLAKPSNTPLYKLHGYSYDVEVSVVDAGGSRRSLAPYEQ